MKRLGRWLCNFVAILSLLLWVVLFVAWIRSRSGSDKILFSLWGTLIRLSTTRLSTGTEVDIVIVHDWSQPETFQWTYHPTGERDPRNLNLIWFSFPQSHAMPGLRVMHWQAGVSIGKPFNMRMVSASKHWVTLIEITSCLLLSLVTAILTVPWIALAYRNHRRQVNQDRICISCGYDLRATPDRCPECGTIPTKRESISN